MTCSTSAWRTATIGLAALAISSVASAAQAKIVAVGAFPDSQFGLTVQTPSPGTTVTADFIENNHLPDGIAFAEQHDVALSKPLALDTGGTLAAGTVVSSYFVGFDDPVGGFAHVFATFDAPVLGIEYLDGGNLGPSDFLGLPSLTYNTGCANCGYEAGDTVSFSGDTATFSPNFSQPGDYARVITAASVPEPATWAMLILGLGAVGVAIRRRRVVLAA